MCILDGDDDVDYLFFLTIFLYSSGGMEDSSWSSSMLGGYLNVSSSFFRYGKFGHS